MLNYPQVALDFMNHDHAEFVTLRDKLLSLLLAQSPALEVGSVLNELLEHTRHHFAEEERLMQAVSFPPFHMHKGEHDAVLADMAAQVTRWKQNGNSSVLQEWLDKNVGDWFVNHVSTMDFVTARFISMKQAQA